MKRRLPAKKEGGIDGWLLFDRPGRGRLPRTHRQAERVKAAAARLRVARAGRQRNGSVFTTTTTTTGC
jgi:hypothetical protein